MFKSILAFITKIFKSETGKEILKAGIDAYVEKNDNKLTNNSAEIIKKVLDEVEED